MGLPELTGPHSFRETGTWSERRLLLTRGIDSILIRFNLSSVS
jgi:hypothetical protein